MRESEAFRAQATGQRAIEPKHFTGDVAADYISDVDDAGMQMSKL